MSTGLEARLGELVPVEEWDGDWGDVLRRTRRTRRPTTRFALAAALLVLALAAVATATYVALRHDGAPPKRPDAGALTVVAGGYSIATPPKVIEVAANGDVKTVWLCTAPCGGELTSLSWSPDGNRLAFTIDAMCCPDVGLHLLDLRTGRHRYIRSGLACSVPKQVAWSPDGTRLAYACGGKIHTVGPDGRGSRPVPIARPGAGWPTWSPDGRSLAFSSQEAIYRVRLDGSHLRLVVRPGTAPAWSPDGRAIAYSTPHGIRLVTPAGVDLTPGRTIAPRGAPQWSPDGETLAVGAQRGVYLVRRTGKRLRRATTEGGIGAWGAIRPAWYPTVAGPPCGAC